MSKIIVQVRYFFLVCFVVGIILFAPFAAFSDRPIQPSLSSEVLSQAMLEAEGQRITVKISGAESMGSGVLIHRQRDRYRIITNRHVLRAAPYQVRTPDGKNYAATIVSNSAFARQDLAILEFRSNQNYSIAKLGNLQTLEVGDVLFATGFPFFKERGDAQGFRFTNGRVALVLPQALEDGYQLGYTNPVEKGMSGGAILNQRGELVGINGKSSHPLWEDTYFYADGTQPCQTLQKAIQEVSWGIPATTIARLSSSIASLSISSEARSQSNSESIEVSELRNWAIAALNCQKTSPIPGRGQN